MKTVYALFRILPNGGSELIAVYSARKKAEEVLDRLLEYRRRAFRIDTFVLDSLPREDLWFDSPRNPELPTAAIDPLALRLQQLKLVIDDWIRTFDRVNRRKRIPNQHRPKSRRART
jgi:hypothetical protein